jgi:hypothetical protein
MGEEEEEQVQYESKKYIQMERREKKMVYESKQVREMRRLRRKGDKGESRKQEKCWKQEEQEEQAAGKRVNKDKNKKHGEQ